MKKTLSKLKKVDLRDVWGEPKIKHGLSVFEKASTEQAFSLTKKKK